MLRFTNISLPLLITMFFSGAMFVPAFFGLLTHDAFTGRIFLYCGILGLGICTSIQLCLANRVPEQDRRELLVSLLYFFMILPLGLAIPVLESIRTTTLVNAYVDMVSAITTTALPTFDTNRLSDTLLLWRSIVAWLGGLFIWISASVIFSPMRLGGFEMVAKPVTNLGNYRQNYKKYDTITFRFMRELTYFSPIYIGLTIGLQILLIASGLNPFAAIIYAMGTVSTAGYHPTPQALWSGNGLAEICIWIILLFNLTRRTAGQRYALFHSKHIFNDREFRLGLLLVVLVSLILFLRHFIGAISIDNVTDHTSPVWMALWGGLFTSLSFLTTTGYVSEGWSAAQNWSGLNNSGIILMVLAIVGGGAATTAGGVKLLRVSGLIRHSMSEVKQLTSPNRIISENKTSTGRVSDNIIWAWVFFMFFFLAFGAFFIAIAYAGSTFEDGLVLTIAALTNTGPIIGIIENIHPEILRLDNLGKLAVTAAMIFGRVESLAILAIFNLDIWRR